MEDQLKEVDLVVGDLVTGLSWREVEQILGHPTHGDIKLQKDLIGGTFIVTGTEKIGSITFISITNVISKEKFSVYGERLTKI